MNRRETLYGNAAKKAVQEEVLSGRSSSRSKEREKEEEDENL